MRHVGTCDEAIQEILTANLPPRCAVQLNNSSEVTVSWYHDQKNSLLISELRGRDSEHPEPLVVASSSHWAGQLALTQIPA